MAPGKIPIVTIEELNRMPTKQLIARLRRLLGCEGDFESSDLAFGDNKDPDELFPNLINYRDTERWEKAYNDVKQVLGTREHVPKGIELKNMRLTKLNINQTKDRAKPKLIKKGKK